MGEVYRARDARLDREVAIKVLPPHHLDSEEAVRRFQREAKAVAALSHPNILSIHDFGEHEGITYAVTELLEGETVAERLRRGPIPLRRALDYAAQMADGLASAHENGIIHRDIKPANLFLTTDGRLSILDFGLAKTGVVKLDPGGETLTVQVAGKDETSPGVVMGTARYMSPEQVRAKTVDHRTDIFSFGNVLLEMLTGAPAFGGETTVEVMNAILNEDPRSHSISGAVIPATVDRIVHRCLEKAPERRFQSGRDLAFALRNVMASGSQAVPVLETAPPETPPRHTPWVLMLAVLILGLALGGVVGRQTARTDLPDPVRVKSLTHSGYDSGPSTSPDGSMLAFVSDRDGRDRIWLRQMNGGIEAPLTEGTDSAPHFAPDGSGVLFLRSEGDLLSAYRVPVLGGSPRKVLGNVVDVCWSPDSREIAFLRAEGNEVSASISLQIMDLQTGNSRELVRIPARSIYGLQWSPDGRWLAASSAAATQNTSSNSVVLVDVLSGEMKLTEPKPRRYSAPTWSPDGKHLIIAESTSLLGDLSGALGRVLKLDPHSGHEQILFWVQSVWGGNHQHVRLDTLDDDAVIFDEILWRGNLSEVLLTGTQPLSAGKSLTQGNSRDRQPAYSPDGTQIIFSSNRSGNLDVWTLELESGELRQVTDDAADDWDPAFGADGRSIFWSSNRGGHLEIWTADIDGSAARQLTNDGVDAENPTQTADGDWVVYGSANPDRRGIHKIRSDGSEDSSIAEGIYILPEVSPDGNHVVYCATDLKRNRTVVRVSALHSSQEVFSLSIPYHGNQVQIQVGRARWMPDGESLVFVGGDALGKNKLYIQDFVPGQDTSESRRVLVEFPGNQDIESFGISPDGTRITVASFDHFRSIKIARGLAALR